MQLFFYIVVSFSLHSVYCFEREMTINVDPRKEDCFYQMAKKGDVIDVEYQVIDGGHGDLDITFHIVDPHGRILIADYKKSENNHRADAVVEGPYKFCFDNSFSAYNAKTVFFELIIEGEDKSEWGSEGDNLDFQGAELFDMKVEDVQEIVGNVRNHLNKIRHFQDLIKSSEARDRNVAEENYFKVNTFSIMQIVIMIAVGFIQVIMVRSLFDDRSKASKIWRNFDRR